MESGYIYFRRKTTNTGSQSKNALLEKGVEGLTEDVTKRSSPSQMFFKIGVLKNYANSTGKHLWWIFFLIKLQPQRPATSLKRDSNTGVFLSNLRNFEEHLWCLLSDKESRVQPKQKRHSISSDYLYYFFRSLIIISNRYLLV